MHVVDVDAVVSSKQFLTTTRNRFKVGINMTYVLQSSLSLATMKDLFTVVKWLSRHGCTAEIIDGPQEVIERDIAFFC